MDEPRATARPWMLGAVVPAFFLVSGASGLVYEVVWTRMMILVFGSTTFAVSTILTAFMGGLALGAWLAARRADRLENPLRAYGLLEVALGASAVMVPLLVSLSDVLQKVFWDAFEPSLLPASLFRFAVALVIFLGPTTLMGATLPVLAALVTRRPEQAGFRVGLLYAVNTAGGVGGTLAAGFGLLPAAGVTTTLLVAAFANVIVGLAACLAASRIRPAAGTGPADEEPPAAPAEPEEPPPPAPWFAPERLVLPAVLATGFAAMALQVAWNRVLGLLIGSSVYAFTIVLASFLAGLAAGSACASLLVRRSPGKTPLPWLAGVLGATAVSVLATLFLFGEMPYLFLRWAKEPGLTVAEDELERTIVSQGWATPERIARARKDFARESLAENPDELRLSVADILRQQGMITEQQQRRAGILVKERSSSRLYSRYLAMQFSTTFLVLLLPTFLMGAVFPLALQVRTPATAAPGEATGRLYAFNTVGAIAGSFAGGFLLVPVLGAADTVMVGAVFYCLLTAGMALAAGREAAHQGWRALAAGAVLCALAIPLVSPAWNGLVMAAGVYRYAFRDRIQDGSRASFDNEFVEGNRLLYYRDGMTTTVTVVEEPTGNVFMATNGKTDASTKGDIATQVLLGEIPMLLAERRERACVIGYASGVTTGSVLLHPVREVVAVEIESAVVEASRYFDGVNGRPLEDDRLRLVNADGRNYLALTEERFDVIVSEPSNPWMTIASNLFTTEFFALGRDRLAPGGIFCQWIQLYCLSTENLRTLVATFCSVFDHVAVFYTKEMVDMLLVGRIDPLRLDPGSIERRMAAPRVAADLDRIGVYDAPSLLARFLIGPREVRAFVSGARLNTDDNVLVEFSAPKTLFTSYHVEMQQMMIERSGGISPYLVRYGDSPAARADFLASVAEAAMDQSDSLEGLAKRFALESAAQDPEGPGKALLAVWE